MASVPLLKHSDGKRSASFTMLVIAFVVVTLWLLVSIVEEVAGIKIREFSSSEAMAYFTPIAMLYFSRRYAEAKGGVGNAGVVVPPSSSSSLGDGSQEGEEEK